VRCCHARSMCLSTSSPGFARGPDAAGTGNTFAVLLIVFIIIYQVRRYYKRFFRSINMTYYISRPHNIEEVQQVVLLVIDRLIG